MRSFLTFVFVLLSHSVLAHELNQSYVFFQVSDDTLSGRFEVTLEDAAQVVPLDEDGDGEISEEEFRNKAPEIFAIMAEGLTLQSNGQTYPVTYKDVSFLGSSFALFGQLHFDVPGLDQVPDEIEMGYVFLYDEIDPTHTGYAIIEDNTRTGVTQNESFISLIFGPGSGLQTLSLVGQSWSAVFYDFIIHGVWHIWIGYDHILFLISLLLPAVLVLRGKSWEPVETFSDAFWRVVKVITLFTISHTITLSLAALGIVMLPSALVEFVIALSIAFMALDNIVPVLRQRTWVIIFLFGLVHGFGFANVLAPLGVDPQHTAVTLAAFNIGVEIGQIAIVIVIFPILFLLRKTPIYQPVFLKLGSVILILIALFWAVERTPALIEGFGRVVERAA